MKSIHRLSIIALLVFVLAGAWVHGPNAWGFNHLSYLPLPFLIIWIFLAGISLLSGTQKYFALAMESTIPNLVFKTRYGPIGLALLASLIFYLLKSKSIFLGDGYLIINLIEKGADFRILDNMDFFLHRSVFEYFSSEYTALEIYQFSSILGGALAVYLVVYLIGKLRWEPWRQTLVLALFLSSGPVLLFFGYVESYTYLYIFVSCYLISAILFLDNKLSILVPGSFLGLALFFHYSAVLCLPSLLVLLTRRSNQKKYGQYLGALLPPFIIVSISVGLHIAEGYNSQWLQHDFFENGNLKNLFIPFWGEHGFVSTNNVSNLWNLFLITTPVSLVLILSRFKYLFGQIHKPEYQFLTSHILTLGIIGIMVDRKLGMARDWDLFVAHTFSIFILAALLVSRKKEKPHSIISLAVTTSFLLSAPWIILESSEHRSLDRLNDVATNFPPQAQAHTYEELGQYYRDIGKLSNSLVMYEKCIVADKYNYRFYALAGAVSSQLAKNSVPESTQQKIYIQKAVKNLEEALRRNPVDFKSRMNLAKLLLITAQARSAMIHFGELVKDQPQNYIAWEYLGKSAAQCGNHQRAIIAFKKVLSFQKSAAILNQLAYSLMEIKNYHEAETVLKQCIEIQPENKNLKVRLVFTMVTISQQDKAKARVLSAKRLSESKRIIKELLLSEPGNSQYKRLESSLIELQ